MTLGAITCLPDCGMGFNRAYINSLLFVTGPNTSAVQSGNVFDFADLSTPGVVARVTILPEFMPWTSNSYTLAYLVRESWYSFDYGAHEIGLPLTLDYFPHLAGFGACLVFNFFFIGTVFKPFALAAAPPGYWLPIAPL